MNHHNPLPARCSKVSINSDCSQLMFGAPQAKSKILDWVWVQKLLHKKSLLELICETVNDLDSDKHFPI